MLLNCSKGWWLSFLKYIHIRWLAASLHLTPHLRISSRTKTSPSFLIKNSNIYLKYEWILNSERHTKSVHFLNWERFMAKGLCWKFFFFLLTELWKNDLRLPAIIVCMRKSTTMCTIISIYRTWLSPPSVSWWPSRWTITLALLLLLRGILLVLIQVNVNWARVQI